MSVLAVDSERRNAKGGAARRFTKLVNARKNKPSHLGWLASLFEFPLTEDEAMKILWRRLSHIHTQLRGEFLTWDSFPREGAERLY